MSIAPSSARPRRRWHHDPSEQRGFTIPELLVAITIEVVIVAALATALVTVLNGASDVNASLKRSSDARFIATYFVRDAQNSSGPEVSLTDTTACADPNPPVSGTPVAVVRFGWTTPQANGATSANVVTYTLVGTNLLRTHCVDGALESDAVLARDVERATVACAPNADCSGTPTAVSVTLTETADRPGATPYTYTLSAAFRRSLGTGASLPPSQPRSLIVLGPSTCSGNANGVTVTGAATLRVLGESYINTADGDSCTAMRLANSGVFRSGSTNFLRGGTCTASGVAVCPTASTYSTPITDPYAGLTPPSTTGMTARSGCPGGVAQPGVYANGLALSGISTCTLSSGIYVLQRGLSLDNAAVLNTAAGGALVYITGGAFTVDGAASLNLTAMTTGPYAGIAVWQAAADTATINFSNGGVLVFNGTIYAPRAQVFTSGDAQTPRATAVVAQSILLTNSGGIIIGASATPLTITGPPTLPPWTVGVDYPSTTATSTGGDGHPAWSAVGLPAGITINSSTGLISGRPTTPGSSTATVTLNDVLGDDPDQQTYVVTINAAPAVATATLPKGEQTAAYATTPAATGGTAPLTWTASGLPAGLSLNSATGAITGTPLTAGTATVSLTVTDTAGVAATKTFTMTIDPRPTISSVTLANGSGTAGTIGKGDTVSVVFSAQMKVSTFCASWTGDAASQTLNGDNDVTVTVADGTGAAHDTLSVTSASCTFGLGTVDLGVNNYVSGGAALLKGSSGNRSSVSWTPSTRTLTVTLGAKASGGTLANVATSTPVFTAGTGLRDSAGGTLGNSPFTLPAGRKF